MNYFSPDLQARVRIILTRFWPPRKNLSDKLLSERSLIAMDVLIKKRIWSITTSLCTTERPLSWMDINDFGRRTSLELETLRNQLGLIAFIFPDRWKILWISGSRRIFLLCLPLWGLSQCPLRSHGLWATSHFYRLSLWAGRLFAMI